MTWVVVELMEDGQTLGPKLNGFNDKLWAFR
jgi:hypothetical protein